VLTPQLGAVSVEITVLLGRAQIPMQQVLRMGRGAVIRLDTREHEEVWILANNHPIARGELIVDGERLSVSVTRSARTDDFFAAES
jgi:flagellar motor switch protein FliN/FliY